MPSETRQEVADALRDWVRNHWHDSEPRCRMLRLGDACDCPLCLIDRLAFLARDPHTGGTDG